MNFQGITGGILALIFTIAISGLTELFPGTQIFDPSGYWKPERIQAAMKELGRN